MGPFAVEHELTPRFWDPEPPSFLGVVAGIDDVMPRLYGVDNNAASFQRTGYFYIQMF